MATEIKGVGDTATMNDVIETMVELSKDSKHPLSQSEVRHVLSYLKEAIAERLKGGQTVQLTSFVTFVPKYRAARKGNNVLTGEKMDIPEGFTVQAKPGSLLKNTAYELTDENKQFLKEKALSKKNR